ncbi:dolichol-P-glucose synthetase [Pedobacter kyungheensis]|uniref:Dolichol-P-glucose synthetase n=1 Tax=Pedobacter kyungheensis TaxID=1069985 RepID=A0A0C1FGX7_9SPHI|nr:glycosyltransferase family 2 protein [Pedobacter kyungheensis]KIA92237.1 dolichol-P-glucose synthetase [Pedobacter kyungheensis]
MDNIELSIVMPCLNEAETVGLCITKARNYLLGKKIKGEIIVADNGSEDGSIEIARSLGAKVVNVAQKGYGNALLEGFNAAGGKHIIMGDSDNSYDFSELDFFIDKLKEGNHIVIGNRFEGGIKDGAMPTLHRYLGNPVLSFLGRIFYCPEVGDFHCGLRGITKAAISELNLKSPGMEFASEMIVKASLKGLKITQVPTILHKDGRNRKPHLNTWKDGWRHLKFLLLLCPRWLFLYPGLLMIILGFSLTTILSLGRLQVGSINFGIHTMFYGAIFFIIGLQLSMFYLFTNIYYHSAGLYKLKKIQLKIVSLLSMENGLIAATTLIFSGLFLSFYAINIWKETGYQSLDPVKMLKVIIPAGITLIMGIQILIASLFLSILTQNRSDLKT